MARTLSSRKPGGDAGSGATVRGPVRVGLWIAVGGLVAAAICLGSARVWRAVEGGGRFRLSVSALALSDCPPCIRAEAMTEELRSELSAILENSSGRNPSVFTRDLAAKVAHELTASPWVVRVAKVSRALPDRLLAEVTFRRPAAVVEFGGARYLVDRDGYALPDALYSTPPQWNKATIPLVVDRRLRAAPTRGRAWGMPRLAVGARLCRFLRDKGLFQQLDVREIDVTNVGTRGAEPDIVLVCNDNVKVKWGLSEVYKGIGGLRYVPPSNSDAKKLAMLLQQLARFPGLENVTSIDLRFHTGARYTKGDG